MGKRSSFERIPRAFYPTPPEAVEPLYRHLRGVRQFVEPCAGDGRLVGHLQAMGLECVGAMDIDPRRFDIMDGDATKDRFHLTPGTVFITNPPWSRPILHAIIEHLSKQAPTWLLFDADWMHTRQSAPFMPYLRKIVSVGRVKWIPDSPFTGKDNCCWYLFDRRPEAALDYPAAFYGRAA